MIVGVTGHRPDKLGGYTIEVYNRLVDLAQLHLRRLKPETVITGMAMGWDMAVAEACNHEGIPFVAILPFVGQEKRWSGVWQTKYTSLLWLAKHVVTEGEGYHSRNELIVDFSDQMLVLWNGQSSGTGFTVDYATRRQRLVINLWSEWQSTFPPQE